MMQNDNTSENALGNDSVYGIPRESWTRIETVFSVYPEIEAVVLYGSRAKGTFRAGSDVDLVLYGADLKSKMINKIALQLDDLLLPYEFDLCIYHYIDNKELIEHIKRVGKEVYKND
jgi:uncharacterized protein